jgi:hypothetical protein
MEAPTAGYGVAVSRLLPWLRGLLPCAHRFERVLRDYADHGTLSFYDELWRCIKCGHEDRRLIREPWRDW